MPSKTTLKTNCSLSRVTTISALVASVMAACAETNPPVAAASAKPVLVQKPAWLMDLSIGIKESYDDNVFLSGVNPSYYKTAALNKVPATIAIARENKASFVTTVSPKVGVNFAPMLGDQKVLQVLALGYAPDFVNYHAASSENYNAHRFSTAVKAKVSDFSLNAENSFNAIEGNKFGALFPGALNSAVSASTLRDRREQLQDRSNFSLQYDQDKFFVRPTATLTYFDYNTEHLTKAQVGGQAGYGNYSDRYDVNGGLDLGYKVTPKFAGTLGYRYGAQYQETFSKAIDPLGLSSSSDYQRVLAGFEGKPFSWLDAKFQIGPDFRKYGIHAPIADPNYTTYYGEASLTATITPNDSLAFVYKQNQFVAGTGKSPYFESAFDLGYKRKLTEALSLDLGARFIESDYTSGLDTTKLPAVKATNMRADSMTTLSVGLTYTFNSYASVTVAYSRDFGRNLEDGLTNPGTREFDRDIVSLGAKLKF